MGGIPIPAPPKNACRVAKGSTEAAAETLERELPICRKHHLDRVKRAPRGPILCGTIIQQAVPLMPTHARFPALPDFQRAEARVYLMHAVP